jgi:hypothetical protein
LSYAQLASVKGLASVRVEFEGILNSEAVILVYRCTNKAEPDTISRERGEMRL